MISPPSVTVPVDGLTVSSGSLCTSTAVKLTVDVSMSSNAPEFRLNDTTSAWIWSSSSSRFSSFAGRLRVTLSLASPIGMEPPDSVSV